MSGYGFAPAQEKVPHRNPSADECLRYPHKPYDTPPSCFLAKRWLPLPTGALHKPEPTLDVKRNQGEYLGMKKSAARAVGKLNLRKLSGRRRKKIARLAIERRWRKARAQEKKARKQYG